MVGVNVWRSWFGWVTLGEALGFCAPAAVGAITAGDSAPALLAAGAVEGAVLGWAQAHVLRRVIHNLPVSRWIALTATAAVLAYMIALTPSMVDLTALPIWAQILAGAIGGTVLLLSIGTAQWLVLRRFVAHASHWIWITAAAWLAGLTVFMVIAPPLWHEGQPLAVTIVIGVLAGLIMAAAAAAVTGWGIVRLLSTPGTSAPAPLGRHS